MLYLPWKSGPNGRSSTGETHEYGRLSELPSEPGAPFAAESVIGSVLEGFGRVWECPGVAAGNPTPLDFYKFSSGSYKI